MRSTYIPLVVCAIALVLPPSAARAQEIGGAGSPAADQVRRPFRGLFAPPPDPSKDTTTAVLTASIYGAYDDNILAGDQPRRDAAGRTGLEGYYSGAQGALQVSHTGDSRSFGVIAGASVQYYPSLSEFQPLYHESANFGTALGRRTRLSLSQQFLYTPNYRFSLFPSFTAPEAPDEGIESVTDFDLFRRTAYRHVAGIGLSRALSRVSSLELDYGGRYVDFTDDTFRDFWSQSAGVHYNRRMTRHATLVLGYQYRRAEYGADADHSPEVHNIDAGVDYSRSLSFSRRTTFGFSTGSSLVTTQQPTEDGFEGRTRLHATGGAHLTHEIGRTWTADVRYKRGLAFREGFDAPFFTDAVGAQLQGLLSRRVEWATNAGYVHASLTSAGAGGYNALTASTQLRYAFTRYLAAYARYFYYQYEFTGDVRLDSRIDELSHRHGVRVGLTTSVPLTR